MCVPPSVSPGGPPAPSTAYQKRISKGAQAGLNPVRGQGQGQGQGMISLWLQHADEAAEQSLPCPGGQKTPSLECCPHETWTSASARSVLQRSVSSRQQNKWKTLMNKAVGGRAETSECRADAEDFAILA